MSNPKTKAADSQEHWNLLEVLQSGRYEAAAEPVKRAIYQDLSAGLFIGMRTGAPASVLMGLIMVPALLYFVPWPWVAAWCLSLFAVSSVRYRLAGRYLAQRPAYEHQPRWRRQALWLSGLLGCVWASLIGTVWFSDNLNGHVYVVLVLSVISGNTFATLGSYKQAYLAATLPTFLAMAFYFLHIASGVFLLSVLISLCLLVYGLIMASDRAAQAGRGTLALLHENRALARDLEQKSALWQTTLAVIADGVVTTDPQGRVTYLNPAAETMTGVALAAAQGLSLSELLQLRDESGAGAAVNLDDLASHGRAMPLPGELVLHTGALQALAVTASLSPLQEPGSTGFVLTLHDVSSLRQLNRDLSHKARHDPLTGLLNRRGFALRLERELALGAEQPVQHCLCLLDLDHFKAVNDQCGHQAGDQVLTELVALIRTHIRDSDCFARLGGDEFAIALFGCPTARAQKVCAEIVAAVRAYRFEWQDWQFTLGVSIGVAALHPGDSPEQLMELADAACYRAKAAGRGQVCVAER